MPLEITEPVVSPEQEEAFTEDQLFNPAGKLTLEANAIAQFLEEVDWEPLFSDPDAQPFITSEVIPVVERDDRLIPAQEGQTAEGELEVLSIDGTVAAELIDEDDFLALFKHYMREEYPQDTMEERLTRELFADLLDEDPEEGALRDILRGGSDWVGGPGARRMNAKEKAKKKNRGDSFLNRVLPGTGRRRTEGADQPALAPYYGPAAKKVKSRFVPSKHPWVGKAMKAVGKVSPFHFKKDEDTQDELNLLAQWMQENCDPAADEAATEAFNTAFEELDFDGMEDALADVLAAQQLSEDELEEKFKPYVPPEARGAMSLYGGKKVRKIRSDKGGHHKKRLGAVLKKATIRKVGVKAGAKPKAVKKKVTVGTRKVAKVSYKNIGKKMPKDWTPKVKKVAATGHKRVTKKVGVKTGEAKSAALKKGKALFGKGKKIATESVQRPQGQAYGLCEGAELAAAVIGRSRMK